MGDNSSNNNNNNNNNNEGGDNNNDDNGDDKYDVFCCPICFDVMLCPVITRCGHSFCRGCIISHLNRSAHCPFDRTVLLSHELIPNRALDNAIDKIQPLHARRSKNSHDDVISTNQILPPSQAPPAPFYTRIYRSLLRTIIVHRRLIQHVTLVTASIVAELSLFNPTGGYVVKAFYAMPMGLLHGVWSTGLMQIEGGGGRGTSDAKLVSLASYLLCYFSFHLGSIRPLLCPTLGHLFGVMTASLIDRNYAYDSLFVTMLGALGGYGFRHMLTFVPL